MNIINTESVTATSSNP